MFRKAERKKALYIPHGSDERKAVIDSEMQ